MLETRKDPEELPLGGGNLKKKPHLVKWSTICVEKKWGLGVRSMSTLNKALLCKCNC